MFIYTKGINKIENRKYFQSFLLNYYGIINKKEVVADQGFVQLDDIASFKTKELLRWHYLLASFV